MPILLVAIAGALFWFFIDPKYQEVKALRAEAASYEEALSNSRNIQAERDKLLSKYNTFASEDIARLERLLPDTVDNVRLVLDINNIAGRYGMIIRDVRLSSPAKDGKTLGPDNRDYGSLTLQFAVAANYQNFSRFLRDLEASLRVVDVSSISFKTGEAQIMDYSVAIRTYWLK